MVFDIQFSFSCSIKLWRLRTPVGWRIDYILEPSPLETRVQRKRFWSFAPSPEKRSSWMLAHSHSVLESSFCHKSYVSTALNTAFCPPVVPCEKSLFELTFHCTPPGHPLIFFFVLLMIGVVVRLHDTHDLLCLSLAPKQLEHLRKIHWEFWPERYRYLISKSVKGRAGGEYFTFSI